MKTMNKPIYFQAGNALSQALNLLFDGTHKTGALAAVLLDDQTRRIESPFTDKLIGQTIHNITDGSKTIITATTATTITGVLAGGTNNSWSVGDVYLIGSQALDVQEQTQFRQIAYEQVTVAAVGTAINPAANIGARAVRVLNNNKDGRVAYVGVIAAGVDASVTPEKGTPIYEGDSEILWVDNANLVYIDANQAASKFDVVVLGI